MSLSASNKDGLSRKRPSDDDQGRRAYPRKRAAQACLTCRRKRTKCDNERPSCTSCASLSIECVYQDGDKSSFDSASLAILQRLDHLENLFHAAHPETAARSVQNLQPLPVSTLNSGKRAEAGQDTTTLSGLYSINIESILKWPVFRVFTQGSGSALKLLLSPPERDAESIALQISDLEAASALSLLKLFLDSFHIFNPVLKVDDVERHARHAVLNGLGWDADSCLLLLIYALGSLIPSETAPFQSHDSSGFRTTTQFRRAEAFFAAAQKRMGPLLCSSGMTEAQVFFLAGVYLMTTMRPLEAWKMFVQALASCHAFVPASSEPDESRLHKSILWTSFKSEIELRLELNIIETSAWNLRYPDFFPEPPQGLHLRSEPAWFFYLAETALRRLENRILMSILQTTSAKVSSDDQISTAIEFEEQAGSWSKSLPEPLSLEASLSDDGSSSDETLDALRFVLEGHLIDCYEMIYWQFMVQAIQGLLDLDFSSEAKTLAIKGFQTCVNRINSNIPWFRKRHHGTWLMIRSCTRSALVLIAAAQKGLVTILPSEWEDAIPSVVTLLKYWQDESKDIIDKLRIIEAFTNSR